MNKSVKKRTIEKRASYGRIKETTIGGIFMSRRYRHIKEYEKNNEIERRRGDRARNSSLGCCNDFCNKKSNNPWNICKTP